MTQEIVNIEEEQQFSIATLPENLRQRIIDASNKLKSSSAVTVNKIRNDVKNFILPDGTETQSFAGIIVAVKHANIHYSSEYEEGVSNPPDCFAIQEGADDTSNDELLPHSMVTSPFSGACAHCSKLQWGSDKGGKGKGKECSEYVLLAVNVPSLGDDLFLLECKKANAKTADGYLANATAKFGHPILVTTNFTMGEKAKWAQTFVAQSPAPGALVTSLAERIDEGGAMLIERVKGSYKEPSAAPAPTEEPVNTGRKARER
jgi:hypothetical protein